jgi:hypothetical protein
MEDLTRRFSFYPHYLTALRQEMEMIGNNESLLYEGFFTVMKIISRLDEYGLLMLPE